ncbi:hypothetical protein HDU67_008595 [Dinochytrium kinnereticum]|nr:hypothetical protein HDU67_008595 [Dinochytrium kinnereticum]
MADDSLVLDEIPAPKSDGEANGPQMNSSWYIATPEELARYLQKLGPFLQEVYENNPATIPAERRGSSSTVKFAIGAELTALPANYTLLCQKRGNDSKHVDKYLYGHPGGSRYRSVNEFKPHLIWLALSTADSSAKCGCLLCKSPKTASSSPAKGRGNRRQTLPAQASTPVTKPPRVPKSEGRVSKKRGAATSDSEKASSVTAGPQFSLEDYEAKRRRDLDTDVEIVLDDGDAEADGPVADVGSGKRKREEDDTTSSGRQMQPPTESVKPQHSPSKTLESISSTVESLPMRTKRTIREIMSRSRSPQEGTFKQRILERIKLNFSKAEQSDALISEIESGLYEEKITEILRVSDIRTVTATVVRGEVEKAFGVDLSSRVDYMNTLIRKCFKEVSNISQDESALEIYSDDIRKILLKMKGETLDKDEVLRRLEQDLRLNFKPARKALLKHIAVVAERLATEQASSDTAQNNAMDVDSQQSSSHPSRTVGSGLDSQVSESISQPDKLNDSGSAKPPLVKDKELAYREELKFLIPVPLSSTEASTYLLDRLTQKFNIDASEAMQVQAVIRDELRKYSELNTSKPDAPMPTESRDTLVPTAGAPSIQKQDESTTVERDAVASNGPIDAQSQGGSSTILDEVAHNGLVGVDTSISSTLVSNRPALSSNTDVELEAVTLKGTMPEASTESGMMLKNNSAVAGAVSKSIVYQAPSHKTSSGSRYRVDELVWVEAVLIAKYTNGSIPYFGDSGEPQRMDVSILHNDIVFWPARIIKVMDGSRETLWGTPMVIDSSKNPDHIFFGTTAFFQNENISKRSGYILSLLQIPEVRIPLPEIYITPFCGVEVPLSLVVSNRSQLRPYLKDQHHDLSISKFLIALQEAHQQARGLALVHGSYRQRISEIQLGAEVFRPKDVVVTTIDDHPSKITLSKRSFSLFFIESFVWKEGSTDEIEILAHAAVVTRKETGISLSKGLKPKISVLELSDIVCRYHFSYSDVVVDACPRRPVTLQIGGSVQMKKGKGKGLLSTIPPPLSDGVPLSPEDIEELSRKDIRPVEDDTILKQFFAKIGDDLKAAYKKNPKMIPGLDIGSNFGAEEVFDENAKLVALPYGFQMFQQPRSNDSKHIDRYIYGHPKGANARFRSRVEFSKHVVWLATDFTRNYQLCSCPLCKSGMLGKARVRLNSSPATAPNFYKSDTTAMGMNDSDGDCKEQENDEPEKEKRNFENGKSLKRKSQSCEPKEEEFNIVIDIPVLDQRKSPTRKKRRDSNHMEAQSCGRKSGGRARQSLQKENGRTASPLSAPSLDRFVEAVEVRPTSRAKVTQVNGRKDKKDQRFKKEDSPELEKSPLQKELPYQPLPYKPMYHCNDVVWIEARISLPSYPKFLSIQREGLAPTIINVSEFISKPILWPCVIRKVRTDPLSMDVLVSGLNIESDGIGASKTFAPTRSMAGGLPVYTVEPIMRNEDATYNVSESDLFPAGLPTLSSHYDITPEDARALANFKDIDPLIVNYVRAVSALHKYTLTSYNVFGNFDLLELELGSEFISNWTHYGLQLGGEVILLGDIIRVHSNALSDLSEVPHDPEEVEGAIRPSEFLLEVVFITYVKDSSEKMVRIEGIFCHPRDLEDMPEICDPTEARMLRILHNRTRLFCGVRTPISTHIGGKKTKIHLTYKTVTVDASYVLGKFCARFPEMSGDCRLGQKLTGEDIPLPGDCILDVIDFANSMYT